MKGCEGLEEGIGCRKIVKEVRAWLEDEVTRETPTDEFKKRKREIQKSIEPVKRRISEAKDVPEALKSLGEVIEKVRNRILDSFASFLEDRSRRE